MDRATPRGLFVAYAHRDAPLAERIIGTLRRFRVVADLRIGSLEFDARTWIQGLIDDSAMMVVIWSRIAASSQWVEFETRYFLQRGNARVVPIIVDDQPLPSYLQIYRAIDLRGRSDELERVIEQFATGLSADVAVREPEKVFVSYSRHDRVSLDAFLAAMSDCQLRPFVDREFVTADESFPEDIVAALRVCRAFCFLSSAHSNDSRHCRREIILADNYGLAMTWSRVDPSPLHDRMSYFLAGIDPWTGGADVNESLCAYLHRQIDAHESGWRSKAA